MIFSPKLPKGNIRFCDLPLEIKRLLYQITPPQWKREMENLGIQA